MTTADRVLELAPTKTQSEIARRLGVSRQAVHSMAKRKGIRCKQPYRVPRCPCGQKLTHRAMHAEGLCNHCRAISRIREYVCSTCGRHFKLTKTEQDHRFNRVRRAPGIYCSRSCFARRPA